MAIYIFEKEEAEGFKGQFINPFRKGGEVFADERVFIMLPFPGEEGTILIGTRTMEFFKYDGSHFAPFKSEVADFLKKNLIYDSGAILSDGNIILGTQNGGAVVINGIWKRSPQIQSSKQHN